MKEVSCRHFSYWFKVIEDAGGSAEKSIEGLPYTKEYLLNPSNRVDWAHYVRWGKQGVREMGGIEASRKVLRVYGESEELGYLARIAGLFSSPRHLYRFIILKQGRSMYSHLHFEVNDLPGGRLQIVIEIPEGYEGSPEYFWASEATFANMTRLLGLPPAKIQTEVTERKGVYTLDLPASRSIGSVFERLWARLKAPFGYQQMIDAQQSELQQLVTDLKAERNTLRELLASLPLGILIVEESPDAVILYHNRAFLEACHPSGEQRLVGQSLSSLPVPLAQSTPGERFEHLEGRVNQLAARLPTTFESRSAELFILRDVTREAAVEERMEAAAEAQRERLAQDLHDGLGQHLAALNFKAEALVGNSPTDAAVALQRIAQLARESGDLGRRIVHGLAPGYGAALSVEEWLKGLCAEMQTQFNIPCGLGKIKDGALSLESTSPDLALVVREALTNAAKHSGATQITLSLDEAPDGWCLTVEDNGCGFHSLAAIKSGGGLGLSTMQARAYRLGGEVEIDSAPGRGCCVRIELPAAVFSGGESAGHSSPLHLPPSLSRSSCPDVRKVFMIDDHSVVRDGVRRLIEQQPGLVFCGEASGAARLSEVITAARPDIVITDLLMDGKVDLTRIGSVRHAAPNARIIVLSMFDPASFERRALAAGADCYVAKSQPPQALIDAIRA